VGASPRPAPGLQRGARPCLHLPFSSFPLLPLARAPQKNRSGNPPERRPPHRVGHRPRAASTPFICSVSFASLPSFSPCLHFPEWWPLGSCPRAPASFSTAIHGGCKVQMARGGVNSLFKILQASLNKHVSIKDG
jgi:hypothetical protein